MSKITIELEDIKEDGVDRVLTRVHYEPPTARGKAPTKAENFALAIAIVVHEASKAATATRN